MHDGATPSRRPNPLHARRGRKRVNRNHTPIPMLFRYPQKNSNQHRKEKYPSRFGKPSAFSFPHTWGLSEAQFLEIGFRWLIENTSRIYRSPPGGSIELRQIFDMLFRSKLLGNSKPNRTFSTWFRPVPSLDHAQRNTHRMRKSLRIPMPPILLLGY